MQRVEDEAIDWLIRLREDTAADWEAFTRWLESDPAHAAAYERIAALDDGLPELLSATPEPPAVLPLPVARGADAPARLRPWGAGIAAALALVVGAAAFLIPRDNSYTVRTAAGEHRTLQLADGSRIDLNGESLLRLDRRDPRRAELASGEAAFMIVHDPRQPFEVRTGNTRIADVGTEFDVIRRAGLTEVVVAAGAVMYDADGARLRLAAGDRLRDPDGAAAPTRSHSDPATVASWRRLRLSFDDRSVREVADEVQATSGLRLTVAEELAARRFTGVIVLDGDNDTLLRRLEPLLDVAAVRQGEGWLLVPVGAPR